MSKERNDLHDYEDAFQPTRPEPDPDMDREAFRDFWEKVERDAELHALLLDAATPEQLRGKI